jgi:hypothetical protein
VFYQNYFCLFHYIAVVFVEHPEVNHKPDIDCSEKESESRKCEKGK